MSMDRLIKVEKKKTSVSNVIHVSYMKLDKKHVCCVKYV